MALTQIQTELIPDASVTQSKLAAGVNGNGPAFSGYRNASQTVTSGVATKVQIDTEEFDTDNAFDNATNFRFTPQVAGYYMVIGRAGGVASTAMTSHSLTIYKNGSAWKTGPGYVAPAGQGSTCGVTGLVYLNGSTDYVELYSTLSGTGSCSINGGATGTFLQINQVRAA